MANSTAPKNYMLGKDLLALRLFGGVQQTVAPFNTAWTALGYLDAKNSTGSADYVRWGVDSMLDMVCSVDDVFANYELGLYDYNCTVGEILKRGGANFQNLIPYIAANYQLVMVQIVRINRNSGGGSVSYGTGTTLTYASGSEMVVFLGTVRNIGDGITTYVKNAVELTLAPKNCDSTYGPLSLFQGGVPVP